MMRSVESRVRWGMSLLLGVGLAIAAAPLNGQDQNQRLETECRCVDRSGDQIQDCTCLRTPRMPMAFVTPGVNRARIGVSVEAGAPDDERAGVRVMSVLEGGPAEAAGLEEGDRIVRVAGKSLFDPLEDQEAERRLDLDRSVPAQRLIALLGDLEPGDPVELEYVRDGTTHRVTLEAEENDASRFGMMQGWPGAEGDWQAMVLPRAEYRFRSDSIPWVGADSLHMLRFQSLPRMRFDTLMMGFDGTRGRALLSVDPCFRGGTSGRDFVVYDGRCIDGVDLVEMNPDLADYFGTDEGALVTSVRGESALGLRPGDVLIGVDGREVRDPDHARRILQSYGLDEELTLTVVRKGDRMEVMGRRR